ncbi:hypothetical protein YN1551_1710 [Sulfolobus islandicus Y.N.15.51]|jgi:hypothetical protein|uniref:Transposase ISC1058 n=1 Tax=Saccharolobus islandicus (strain Y.N.15.51 / Yellowstone \|nr:hypothetical protein YN1551_1710 [Sulfolobus islandicus Y.N.15.51]
MEKKNTRDWSKYDENVVTRYKLMFPFYVFERVSQAQIIE